MYKIICKELTSENCDFIVEGETAEEVKEKFYAHGAESELHKETYGNASQEDIDVFSKEIDEYLRRQR